MRPAAALVPFFLLLAAIGAFAAGYSRLRPDAAAASTDPDRPRVKLAVLVFFDQLRGDFPEKWRPLFGPGGFHRLQTEGATFTRCYYPYGTTTTGPGHASVLTGTCMDRHGIVNNNWHEKGKDTYCSADPRWSLVPTPPPAAIDPKTGRRPAPPAGGTPERLLSETVADVLKRVHGPRAMVFGLSLKDRSAILPTGQTPDGAFWFNGRFVTSTYYTDKLGRTAPPWVAAFNASGIADRWFGKDWVRLRPDLDYAAYSDRDDAPGEGTGSKQGKTFPHPITGGLKAPGKEYYEALANSPFANDLLLEFAKTCIREEGLGRDDVPDLLVVSFSSNDIVGHTWGPDSQEVLDITLRTDALLADLMGFLDANVGGGNYALALTADHGMCSLPEHSAAHGRDARRVDTAALRKAAEAHLREAFGTGGDPKKETNWIEPALYPWLYLNPRLLKAAGRDRAEVARSLADFLATQPGVGRAFTRDDLAGEFAANDGVGRRVKRAFHPARSGDVYVMLKPYHVPMGPKTTGGTHGSPHAYDAHVPLMVLGPGVAGGTRTEPVTPQAAAAIFAHFLGVPAPADAEFPVPATLLASPAPSRAGR